MGVAEEEVLIRDDSGLLLDTSEVRIPKSQVWRRKLTRTICLALGFLVLGLCVAIPGPTLLDLEDQVKASTSQMMIVLASRSLGYLLGALLGGMLFDCFDKQLLLFCTLLVSSVATVVIPWSLTLVIMGTMFALQGITMGVLDTGGNVYCIQLWGRKNGPFIQTLHFAFGIGAFVAPLLARPFLSSANFTYNSTIVQGNIPVAPFLHEHHALNMTRRSVVDIFTELNKFQQDLYNSDFPTYGISHNLMWNKTFTHSDSDYSAIQLTHPSQLNVVPGIHLAKRHSVDRISKREVIDEISKREVIDTISKREVTDPSNSNISESVSQESADIPIVTNSPSITPSINSSVSEDENGAETLDENGAKTVDENGIRPENENGAETVDENENEVKTVINSTEIVNTSSTVQPNITTVAVTPLTTSEKEVVKKPTAVTDNNRKSSSADGKPIIKHLDDHNIKAGPDSKAEQGPEVAPGNAPPVLTTGLNGTELNETVNGINSTDTSDLETATNDITEKNSTQNVTEPVKNSDSESPSKGPEVISTTIKAPDVSKSDLNVTKEPLIPVKSSATKATTTTLAPAPTTKTKITTTTAKATTTTTTKAPTTTTSTTTTTATSTTTTTTPKPPSTTTPKKTTETPIPTTARPTATVKPTSHVDTDTVTEHTTKPVPVVKTTVNSTVNNTGNEPTTTEISKKPETTVDSFINHAITAVKNISRIQFAYIIIGLALFLIAIVFLVLYCQDKRRLSACDNFAELMPFKSVDNCTKYSLVILLGLFFFSYMGLEVTFGALVSIFATEHNHWPKEQGAVVAAIFWGSLATGRGLSIFMARCCGPTVMLTIDLFFMLIGGLVLAIGIPYYDKLLWLGTLILGLGMSSAFPAGISWAETRFHLSGKTTAIFVTGSAIGQMVIPILSGYLYESYGAMYLMYVTVVLTITTIIMFILMQCVSVKRGNNLQVNARNGGFLPLEDVDDDDALEMGDLVHFDKSQTRKIRDTRQGARGNAEYHTLISDLDDD